MIELKNISKNYGKQCVLDALDLTCHSGEIQLLVGRNGEGKSSLLELMSCLYKPDRGQVLIRGKEVCPANYSYRSEIGYVFAAPMYMEALTVVEYLLFVCRLYGIERQTACTEIGRYLNLFDLPAEKRIANLSKGMKKQVALIAAILHKPSFLIMDEPFDGFDVIAMKKVRKLMEQLKASGTGVFIVSHQFQQLYPLADRISLLQDGKIRFNYLKKELEQEAQQAFPGENAVRCFLENCLE